ncbi:anhydro-N-acetylmuramic acid kinase [Lysobacter humi (ex Lee et al. 2017)]
MGGDAAADGLYVGLISGTSADGIDAALVRFSEDADRTRCEVVCALTHPWDSALRTRLVELGQGGDARSLDEIGTLDVRVAEAFADATRALLDTCSTAAADVHAIGSHGQTVRHRPAGVARDGRHPFSWQLGDPSLIAERCGITTVADFRRRDIAAGGQGAPLVPAFHAAVLRASDEDRAVLNLGGIANYTLLPAHGDVRGFDTGPANALMDAWCLRHTGDGYDCDGRFAARGTVDEALLSRLLAEPWFALPPPKSSGREQFHLGWVDAHLAGDEHAEDVQATLLEVTARTVTDALLAQQPTTTRVLLCGGGVRNPQLVARIGQLLPGCRIESTDAHGLDADFVEAAAFAWLARQTLLGRPGNLPSATGAAGDRVLGAIYPA